MSRAASLLLLAALAGACRDPLVIPDRVDDATGTRDESVADVAELDAERPDASVDDAGDARDALMADDATGDASALPTRALPDRRVTCGPRSGTPAVTAGAADRFVLRGRVVTPATVLAPGEVLVVGNRIACVARSCADRPGYTGATVIDTAGIVYPGLVDGHNHVAYDWLPEWTPPRMYSNRYQWQRDRSYDAFVEPYSANVGAHECAMTKYGEIRALVAGTTSIQGAPQRTCIRTLVRNVEYGWDFDGIDRHRTNVLGISTVSGTSLTTLQREIRDGTTTAYIIHLAEGIDEPSRAEFDELESKMLLTSATVVVHGTAFTSAEDGRLGTAGGKLVWSPRSNMVLYGRTTDVPAALAAGVMVALAPDWTPSGGPNVLSELRYAREVSRRLWGGRLTSRDLVEMVTSRAARALDRQQFVGTLEEGRFADLMVIPDTGCDPYDALIDAPTADVELVMVGGRPLYGDRALMNSLPAALLANCEDVAFCGVDKRLCVSQGAGASDGLGQRLTDIEAEIRGFYPTPLPLVPLCP
jgi:cytosine/adenosine deaminase-related metal-dependent hydrolase